MQDFLYAVRTLKRSPAFAAIAVVTLALGIGASTAIFSVTNSVLLRPLPYRNADRLVSAWLDLKKPSVRGLPFNNADFFDLRDGTRTAFEDMGSIFVFRVIAPGEDGTPERIYKAQVSTNFFRLMGARIAFGRDFTDADGEPQPVSPEAGLPVGSIAILSYDYWLRRYGGSPAILGHEMIAADRRGPRIVGVLALGFQLFFPPSAHTEAKPDIWIANDLGYTRGPAGMRVVGRLKSGVSIRQAQEQADRAAMELRKNAPGGASSGMSIRLEPMLRHLVGSVRPAILALMGAVTFLLLIACANVANLFLVRTSLRERELAVRAALGGGWRRLMSQLLAEVVLISALGTLTGLGVAWAGVRGLLSIAPATLPRLDSVSIDWRVLAFATLAGVVAAGIFGLIPGWRAAQPDVMRVLRGAGRSAALEDGRLMRNSVVIAEVALAFVLLIGSGLMLRSFVELQRVDPGYDPHGVLTFLLVRDWPFTQRERGQVLMREIRSRLSALPGVESVGASARLPLTGGFDFGASWATEQSQADGAKPQTADLQAALPGYFEVLRTPLIEGRAFTDRDNVQGRNVVIIDQLLAAKAFPNESAVGKRIFMQMPNPAWLEIIGVVRHQRLASLASEGREQIYLPDASLLFGVSRSWAVRTSGDPAKYAPAIRAELARFDPQLLMLEVQPMDTLVAKSEAGTRFALLLIGVFSAFAALLAAVGLYGVLATSVRQRTAEIGVRIALGASPASVLCLIIGNGFRLSAAGIAIGLAAAFALTRMMAGMFVGIKPTDPATFAAVAAGFFVIAAFASWLPARRAASLDPARALREE